MNLAPIRVRIIRMQRQYMDSVFKVEHSMVAPHLEVCNLSIGSVSRGVLDPKA
jgi:hypothetical protein